MKLLFSFILFFVFVFSPLSTGELDSFNRERKYDVQHYVIRVKFDQKKKTVYGDSTIRLKPLASNFDTVVLDADGIDFDSVRSANSGKPLKYSQENGKLVVSLGESFDQEDIISVRTKYKVVAPKKGVYFVKPRKKGQLKHSSQIWTQGESEETHYWLPSFDFPSDKATSEQFITVNSNETAIGNGKLISKKINRDGTKTFHFKMSQPHSLYLTSFVVGEYAKVSDKYGDIPLNYYVYPGQENLVPGIYGKTKDMFRIFEDITNVKYPFDKYDQTVVGDFAFGGMENITATTMSDNEIFYGADKSVEDLVSHELAHSWFGNMVTIKNWAELWLNESFATYMESAYREKKYGRSDYLRKIQEDANQYFAYAAVNRDKLHGLFNRSADAKNDSTMFTTITYQKGSVVLHMLRTEIGDEAFWKGVNLYLTRHKFGNVETQDLQNAFEKTSNRKLGWFFKQWVYGNKFPKIKVKQTFDTKTKNLILDISQNHVAGKYTSKAFRLPLDVAIISSNSTKSTKIVIDSVRQSIRIPVDEKPYQILIDKENKIPLKDLSLSRLEIAK